MTSPGFRRTLEAFPRALVEERLAAATADRVRSAVASAHPGEGDLLALLSPAAGGFLEEMARRSQRITEQRFGRVIGLFAPLYLSNACSGGCLYCGFSTGNPAPRVTLTVSEAEAEARALHEAGFRHVLLVSGEAPKEVGIEYLERVAAGIRPLFASISIEVYPMEAADYRRLARAGVDGLVCYQETYDEDRYRHFHPSGGKRDYGRRLSTPARGGEAGLRRIGLGALLGLDDWRVEGFFLALHARWLLRHFWKSQITISFPRLRPAAGGFRPPLPVSDAALVQLMTALRIFLPDVGLVLSTREPAGLRDNLVPLGVTMMSAGSRTDPGGYAGAAGAESQFEIADHRSAPEVAAMIRRQGYEPVWKDYDAAFLSPALSGSRKGFP